MKTKIACLVLISMLFAGKGFADLSLIKPQDAMVQVKMQQGALSFENTHPRHKSHAPEPSTLLLFGGGVLGIVTSFARRMYATAKRGVDIIGSIIALVLLMPFSVLAAVLIKLTSRGPVIFKQIRMGKDGRLFNIYKFRTMKMDAEKDSGPVWASQNDSRMIPVGNFLRKTHFDEIPQFVNVLKGEMSIVGPRPERPFFVEKLKGEIAGYEQRLRIKPGITGLAQVCHRADETTTDVKFKVKYDILYIKKMSLAADMQILYRTLRLVCAGGIASIWRFKV